MQVVRGQPSLQDLKCLRRQSERHWVILRNEEEEEELPEKWKHQINYAVLNTK